MKKEVVDVIVNALKREKADFVVTLPEDPSVDLVERISHDNYFTYIRVVNEGQGIGITAGAALAGRRAVFVTGIAGLLVATWELSWMSSVYRIPFVLLVSNRGDIGDRSSVPGEFSNLFRLTGEPLLKVLQVQYKIVGDPSKLAALIHDAFFTAIENRTPVAILLTEDALW